MWESAPVSDYDRKKFCCLCYPRLGDWAEFDVVGTGEGAWVLGVLATEEGDDAVCEGTGVWRSGRDFLSVDGKYVAPRARIGCFSMYSMDKIVHSSERRSRQRNRSSLSYAFK